jgi:hypothetical protein
MYGWGAMLPTSNFAFLAGHDSQLVQLGALAERYFRDDPATAIFKLRQYAELLSKTAPSTIHRLINDGIIAGEQITPGPPWRIRLDSQQPNLQSSANRVGKAGRILAS